jgi:hypothetical protein
MTIEEIQSFLQYNQEKFVIEYDLNCHSLNYQLFSSEKKDCLYLKINDQLLFLDRETSKKLILTFGRLQLKDLIVEQEILQSI